MGCSNGNSIKENNVEQYSVSNVKNNNVNNSQKQVDYTDEYIKARNNNLSNNSKIFLGINIGAFKTVYSIFSLNENQKYIYQVLLMNESSRIIPSIICYSNHREFGENSKSFLKQNLKTSFNNLSRLIGFDKSNEEELKYMYSKEGNLKKIEEIGNINIIADFLNLINEYYFEKQKIKYDITCLSVPDFYTENQRKELRLICEAIGMKEINIYNESSAITMYYGYAKYQDLFGKNEMNSKIEKYILFVDIGHSKTSFILSKFKYDKFEVEYVKLIPDIGGRNIDLLLYNYCIEKFRKNNELEEITDRNKFRLIEEINEKKKNFIINEEIQILVDEYSNSGDLNIIINKEKFEEIINEIIKEIKKGFEEILEYIKDKKIKINSLEIAGEIMRIPTFQEIFKKQGFEIQINEQENNKEKKGNHKKENISKTILIDECISVGAALLGNYYKGDFPLKNLKEFNNKVTTEKFEYIKQEELIKEIQNHIQAQKKLDNVYNKFTENKNKYKDYIYSLRKVDSMSHGNLEEINNLQKKLQKIEYKEEKDIEELEDIHKQIKKYAITIINDLIDKLKQQSLKESIIYELEKMKDEKDFPYKKFGEFYQNKINKLQ